MMQSCSNRMADARVSKDKLSWLPICNVAEEQCCQNEQTLQISNHLTLSLFALCLARYLENDRYVASNSYMSGFSSITGSLTVGSTALTFLICLRFRTETKVEQVGKNVHKAAIEAAAMSSSVSADTRISANKAELVANLCGCCSWVKLTVLSPASNMQQCQCQCKEAQGHPEVAAGL